MYQAAYSMAVVLGPEKVKTLLMFNNLTVVTILLPTLSR